MENRRPTRSRSYLELCTSNLQFHIINCKESKEAWDKLKSLYGIVDEEKGFQIEDDLLLLDRKSLEKN